MWIRDLKPWGYWKIRRSKKLNLKDTTGVWSGSQGLLEDAFDTVLIFRLHLGIWSHGELHQEDLPSDPVGCGRLQPGWKHCVQVPGREPGQPGEGSVLCQRVPGVQRAQVSLQFCPGFFCRVGGRGHYFSCTYLVFTNAERRSRRSSHNFVDLAAQTK